MSSKKEEGLEERSNKLERKGLFLYSKNFKESMGEEQLQSQLCELMEMYQTYHDITLTKQYVLRGSKMTCIYGTKPVLLDTQEDHGVYMGKIPVMACSDCSSRNIHSFGSCMCLEAVYEKRLPMTPPVHRNGEPAILAPGNRYPHICIPLASRNGWQQEEDRVLIEDSGQAFPVLVDSATLVCQYGGLIMIWEVPEKQKSEKEVPEIKEFKGKEYMIAVEKKIAYIYSTKEYDPKLENPYPEWKGEFDDSMDLTFGIGHSIKTEEEFKEIKAFVENNNDIEEMEKYIDKMYQADLKKFVDRVNNFCIDNHVYLTQNQFDAVVMLQYNCDFQMEGSDLGEELAWHKDDKNPEFDKDAIVQGFTYTMFQGVRIDGLVTRRNNELNLFFNNDYNYYDTKNEVNEKQIAYIEYP